MIKILSKRYMMNGLLLGLILTFSYSCIGPEEIPEPENLLSEDIYIDLLVEFQHVITYRNAKPDSVNTDSLTALIYEKYQVTEDEFLVSHEYYQKQVKEQVDRVDKALQRLKAEEDQLKAHIDSVRKANAPQDSTALADTSQIMPELQHQPTLRKEN